MFHMLAYSNVQAGATTLQDATAVADANFSIRNGHYIFTEPYKLLAATGAGALIIAQEFNIPSMNAVAKHNIYPVLTSLTVTSNPNVDDYRAQPVPLPLNEEIAVLQSASGAETESVFLWIGTPDWNLNLPQPAAGPSMLRRRITVLATQTTAKGNNVWGADTALTFETALRGGVYAVIGAECVAAGVQAFRINFPRRPLYSGRKTLPGNLATQTYGNQPNKFGRQWMGEWGRFHTFEPPFLELFGSAAGNVTPLLFLDLIYLGEDLSLLGTPGVSTI